MARPEWLEHKALDAGVGDAAEFAAKCRLLFGLLAAANQKDNLTRVADEAGFWTKHVADSLSVAEYFPEVAHAEILDVGCGGGFPSLVLAAAFPDAAVTAVDSIAKKTAFVAAAAETLDLINLTTVTARARELNREPEWRERFDIVTARAVADAKTIFRETRAMLKPDGKMVLYKTPSQRDEITAAARESAKYGFEWVETPVFDLPDNAGQRLFLWAERK